MFSGTVWYNCKGKKGFQKYLYQKLSDELEEYAARFPMMTAQELVEWARHCHPNVSIHVYDSAWRKFMKHIASKNNRIASLVFYIKDHHLYPIQDNHLKHIATQANQGGADNLWKYMTDMKWSNKSSNYIMYQDLVDDEDDEIVAKPKDKPTLSTIENNVIVLPPIIIETYMIRTNYFVDSLHYDNNGRLDGFMDHKNNMYLIIGNERSMKLRYWKLTRLKLTRI